MSIDRKALPQLRPSVTADNNARDIAAARAQATFSVERLANYLYGGKQRRLHRDRILRIVEKDPVFSKSTRYYRSLEEQIAAGLAQSRRLVELRDQHGWNEAEFSQALTLVDDFLPITLHHILIKPLLRTQCTPKQQSRWLKDAEDWRIIGCYAQTELAHGSDLSKLETTATYIRETDEFEINSNSFTGSKWWIGGLGEIATHTILQARLILGGKDYGAHMFMVPIRSLDTHKPFPGITIGNIGPKAFGATNSTNNGFAYFDGYRIPRDNMLAKFAHVSKDGVYVSPPHAKVGYAGMLLLRVSLARDAGWALARAATIAIRYSAVRRQFASAGEEVPVLQYPNVYRRLLPFVAQAHVMLAGTDALAELFSQLNAGLATNDVSLLPEAHATSCCLKSLCTKTAADGIEEARRALGGHGYSAGSGYGAMYGHYVASNTVEGDNFLITQQTARFLLKVLQQANSAEKRSLPASAAYLAHVKTLTTTKCTVERPEDWLCMNVQEQVLTRRAARLAVELATALLQERKPWQALNTECWRLSVAHGHVLLASAMRHRVEEIMQADSVLYPVMKRLSELWFLHTVETHLGDFLEDGSIAPHQVQMLRAQLSTTLSALLPDAVGLVDAFDFPDYVLDSTLGRSDGRAYENLWENALRAPPINSDRNGNLRSLDATPFGYEEYIRPLLKRPARTGAKL
ncbi:acyl-CoA dehydrogenase/oxidase [Thamnocephalis sphaerospora]|uniref:Acyl-coenzyme A oxidase n=1 Tax=Thamnocephalis sphaerospora TaxID=78915 RepID=A0A4P9XNL8_9FUNG|nr:acyl-CoA dehydrogenase/oxidase [Thamnocephalis sphaerospora]|eukprot:RKP06830.1 acyl-CoA dehydrogenase/oxidase [Thamnocephalis sphaerospora]